MAFDPLANVLIDPHDGQADLTAKIIRAVGDPSRRFFDDGLRLLRAIRLMAQLDFGIEQSTKIAIGQNASRIQKIAKERIGRELTLLLLADGDILPALQVTVNCGLMKYMIPELLTGQGLGQSRLHHDDVLTHNLRTCALTPANLPLRLAGLLHDVGKPNGFEKGPYGRIFPEHAARSAALTPAILARLRFDKKLIALVTLLVRHHMVFWRPNQSLAPIRRVVGRVGWENTDLLLELIKADRMSIWGDINLTGISALAAAIDQVKSEDVPINAAGLALTSNELMTALDIKPGPIVGQLRRYLLEAVWEDPKRNDPGTLLSLAQQYFTDNGRKT